MGLQNTDIYIADVADKPSQNSVICSAHKHGISQLKLDAKGALLASTSDRGTIIRVHETKRGETLQEFRRAFTTSVLTSLCFSRNSSLLCATSDRSAHVFQLKDLSLNTNSGFGFFRPKESQRLRSFITFDCISTCTCCFDRMSSSVILVCSNGFARKMKLDESTKTAEELQVVRILQHDSGHLFRVDLEKWREAHRGYREQEISDSS